MKKIARIFVVTLLVSTAWFTSCIDNTVAPEIAQLRTAQVAYLTAQANLEEAQAAAQVIQNTFDGQ